MAARTPVTFVAPALVAWLSLGCGDGGSSPTGTATDASSTAANPFTTWFGSTESTASTESTVGTGSQSDATSESEGHGGEGHGGAIDFGSCTHLPRAGATALIDDFEGDGVGLPYADGRTGAWYTSDDGSSQLHPTPYEHTFGDGAFAGDGAARLQGEGFRSWGGSLGVVLYHNGQHACPYDASPYDGISFWARGGRSVFLHFSTVHTVPVEEGGRCTVETNCSADWGITLRLTEDWRQYVVRWSELQPPTWGIRSAFEPNELVLVQWQFVGPDPFDLWIDDLAFYTDGHHDETGSTGSDDDDDEELEDSTDDTSTSTSTSTSTGEGTDASTGNTSTSTGEDTDASTSDTDASSTGASSGDASTGDASTGDSSGGESSTGESSRGESTAVASDDGPLVVR